MAEFIHKLHHLLVVLVRYSLVFTVIFFLPVPLSHFLTGSVLSQTQHSPLFEYFTHYNISTDQVLENTYTNVYIGENKDELGQWDIDNAILWADALAYTLEEENIPVIKKVIGQQQKDNRKINKSSKTSKVDMESNNDKNQFVMPEQIKQTLINMSQSLHTLMPFISLTQDARQWIILALDSTPKKIKKQLKKLINQHSDDNFLIITRTPINLGQKSVKMNLPQFNEQEAKNILVQGLRVSKKQAQILLRENKNSLLSIIKDNDSNQQFSIKSLLGQNYNDLDDMNPKQQEILDKLCREGKVKVGKIKIDLSDYGVVVKNKSYQWLNEQSELNYQLRKEIYCSKKQTAQHDSKVTKTQVQSKDLQKQLTIRNNAYTELAPNEEIQQPTDPSYTSKSTQSNQEQEKKQKEQL